MGVTNGNSTSDRIITQPKLEKAYAHPHVFIMILNKRFIG
ncbi:hypothetical protein VCRLGP7_180089 [Vibrio crassostreae]|nr:hypothetical protein VCRLGP7_180089 [Vibrio crassostreae]